MGTPAKRTTLTVTIVATILVLGACSSSSSSDPTSSTSTVPDATSTTTTTAVSTTLPASTSTASAPETTTTTTATTTTSTAIDASPMAVTGLTVGIGGGSGEVIPTWDRGSEADLAHYNVWYSFSPSAGKTLLASVDHDVTTLSGPAYDAGSGRTAYVDFPRTQAEGTQCYQVSAVDAADNEGARSAEVCLPVVPPGAVSGFTVGIGGGSGEVFLTWSRGPEPDLDHYNLWHSELPGASKSLLSTVAHDPGSLPPPAYDYGGGATAYVDFPRELTNDKQCYQISAVDASGNEGPRTTELCLAGL